MNNTFKDITGERFGRLTVITFNRIQDKLGNLRIYWVCECDCGNQLNTLAQPLLTNKTKSCGCLNRERITIHGQTINGNVSKAWQSWRTAKSRCYRIKDNSYKNYGGRGITMCDRWKNSFENFFSDMGSCPEGCSLDRINVNGNYELQNCKWATGIEQANNKRNNHLITNSKGETKTATQWAREFNISFPTVIRKEKLGTLFN